MKRFARTLVFLTLFLFLAGCGDPGADSPPSIPPEDQQVEEKELQVTDSAGQTLIFPACPTRVVSLQASLSEIWLNAGGSLVGVTDDMEERGMDPGEAALIGTVKSPNVELILSLEPDLTIYSPDIAGQSEAAEVLAAAGVPVFAAKVDTFHDYLGILESFSALTGDEQAYQTYGLDVEAAIQNTIDQVPEGEAPRVLFLRGYSSGVKAKARDHVVCDILNDLGAVNIADQQESLLEEISMEVILAEDPEYIFLVFMGTNQEENMAALEASLTGNPAWGSLQAVQNDRFILLDRELYHYKPNQRWGEAYAQMFDYLYGEES